MRVLFLSVSGSGIASEQGWGERAQNSRSPDPPPLPGLDIAVRGLCNHSIWTIEMFCSRPKQKVFGVLSFPVPFLKSRRRDRVPAHRSHVTPLAMPCRCLLCLGW